MSEKPRVADPFKYVGTPQIWERVEKLETELSDERKQINILRGALVDLTVKYDEAVDALMGLLSGASDPEATNAAILVVQEAEGK